MNKLFDNIKSFVLIILGWRIILFLILLIAINTFPLYSKSFLGGGLDNYLNNPHVFAFANFDGEHYLDIAQRGYVDLNHSFFPLYPLILKSLSFDSHDLQLLAITGTIFSLICFIGGLIFFRKLANLDFPKNITNIATLLVLLFPTSFYFAAVYTESLFLLLTIASFYFIRKNNWFLGSLLGGLASATRVTGIILLPVFLIEWFLGKRNKKDLISLLLIPMGLFAYMYYLYLATGDPFKFYNELSAFGEQRSGNFVLLPQVFYRYLKILLTPDLNLLVIWTTVIELMTAIVTLALIIYGFSRKIRISYLLYCFLAFLVPTFTGSFSSLPRYVVVLFPLFIIFAKLINHRSTIFRTCVYLLLTALFIIESALFFRGYFVA